MVIAKIASVKQAVEVKIGRLSRSQAGKNS